MTSPSIQAADKKNKAEKAQTTSSHDRNLVEQVSWMIPVSFAMNSMKNLFFASIRCSTMETVFFSSVYCRPAACYQ